jgi:hypothetical protein
MIPAISRAPALTSAPIQTPIAPNFANDFMAAALLGSFAASNQFRSPFLPFGSPATQFGSPGASYSTSNHASANAQPRSPEIPLSDPFDETEANPYPSISEFLTILDKKEPRRNLLHYIDIFESQDYYHINEL